MCECVGCIRSHSTYMYIVIYVYIGFSVSFSCRFFGKNMFRVKRRKNTTPYNLGLNIYPRIYLTEQLNNYLFSGPVDFWSFPLWAFIPQLNCSVIVNTTTKIKSITLLCDDIIRIIVFSRIFITLSCSYIVNVFIN